MPPTLMFSVMSQIYFQSLFIYMNISAITIYLHIRSIGDRPVQLFPLQNKTWYELHKGIELTLPDPNSKMFVTSLAIPWFRHKLFNTAYLRL